LDCCDLIAEVLDLCWCGVAVEFGQIVVDQGIPFDAFFLRLLVQAQVLFRCLTRG